MSDPESDNRENGSASEAGVDGIKRQLLLGADTVVPEEKVQLQQLVHEAMGLKPPKSEMPPADPGSIERITTTQIKSMRQVTAKQAENKELVVDQFTQGLIKFYFDVIGLFSFGAGHRKGDCLISGHECMHCGQRFSAFADKALEKK